MEVYNDKKKKKIHQASWKRICKLKKEDDKFGDDGRFIYDKVREKYENLEDL